jgi:hypothetical protein
MIYTHRAPLMGLSETKWAYVLGSLEGHGPLGDLPSLDPKGLSLRGGLFGSASRASKGAALVNHQGGDEIEAGSRTDLPSPAPPPQPPPSNSERVQQRGKSDPIPSPLLGSMVLHPYASYLNLLDSSVTPKWSAAKMALPFQSYKLVVSTLDLDICFIITRLKCGGSPHIFLGFTKQICGQHLL